MGKNVKISDIQLVPARFKDGLAFFANFVLDGKYFIGNVAVYSLLDGSGFRLVYPDKKLPNGQQIPLFHPINRELGDEIQREVSAEAMRLLAVGNNKLAGKYIFGSRFEEEK